MHVRPLVSVAHIPKNILVASSSARRNRRMISAARFLAGYGSTTAVGRTSGKSASTA